MFSLNVKQDVKQKSLMHEGLLITSSSQGNLSLISCVRRTWKWLYWRKCTKPRILSETLAKNLGKGLRIRKTCREISPGCSHSFWYFFCSRILWISHFGSDQIPHLWTNSSFMNLFITFLNSQNLFAPTETPFTPGDPAGETCPENNTLLLSNLNLPPAEVSAIWLYSAL